MVGDRWSVKKLLPTTDHRLGVLMVQMRSILEVADKSGAKKIAMILPLRRQHRASRQSGRCDYGVGQGSQSGRRGQEEAGGQSRNRPHAQKVRRKDGT